MGRARIFAHNRLEFNVFPAKYPPTATRAALAGAFALASALAFQLFGLLVATVATRAGGFGAPIQAGSANLSVAERASFNLGVLLVDVLLTTLILFAPAWRSLAHVIGALAIGVVLYIAMIFALPNSSLLITHIAWWVIGMLPAIVLGFLPNLRAAL